MDSSDIFAAILGSMHDEITAAVFPGIIISCPYMAILFLKRLLLFEVFVARARGHRGGDALKTWLV